MAQASPRTSTGFWLTRTTTDDAKPIELTSRRVCRYVGVLCTLDRSDPNHRQAREGLGGSVRRFRRRWSTNLVLAEAHALCLTRRGREDALRFVEALLTSDVRIERVQPVDEERALAILRRYTDKDLSYTDALSFAVMERLEITVALSYDRHFRQYGFTPAGD